MPLTGKDVWDAIVKLGLMSGPYDPRRNSYCANAAMPLQNLVEQRGEVGIDAAIERDVKKRKPSEADSTAKKVRP